MAKALSVDLRDRVIAAVKGGLSRRQAASRFGVSAASAIRWCALERAVGDASPKRQGGDRRSGRIEAYRQQILGAIETTLDITLAEIAVLLRDQHGVSFAPSTVWRFLNRHAVTFKNNGARGRTGSARRRRAAAGVVGGAARS